MRDRSLPLVMMSLLAVLSAIGCGASSQSTTETDGAPLPEASVPNDAPHTDTSPKLDVEPGCAPGTARCEGLVPVACTSQGTSQRGAPCAFACAAGACTGECVAGSVSCNGPVPIQCENGTWVEGKACSAICTQGECRDSCVVGTSDCDGTLRRTCASGAAYDVAQVCPFQCRDGACVGECVPGSVQCGADGKTPMTCSAQGTLLAGEPCPGVCTLGVCRERCTEGETQCSAAGRVTCQADGTWASASACPFVCSAGACVGVCRPGSRRCAPSGAGAEDCDARGEWVLSQHCAGNCTGEGVCGTAADAGGDGGTPPPDGNPGLDANQDGGLAESGTLDATLDAPAQPDGSDATARDAGAEPDAADATAQDAGVSDVGVQGDGAHTALACDFAGPRVKVAEPSALGSADETRGLMLGDTSPAHVTVLYDNTGLRTYSVASFDPAQPAGLNTRDLGVWGRSRSISPWGIPDRHMLFVTQDANDHDVGLSVIAVSGGDFAAPLSVATLPSQPNHAPRGATGWWEPAWNGQGPGTYYFAVSYQNFDDSTAATYAGIATPGTPVVPTLIQNYRPAVVQSASPVLLWTDRFEFVEEISSPTSTRTTIISVPTLAGFGMADVTKREVQVSARPYLVAQTPFDGTGRNVIWVEEGDGTPGSPLGRMLVQYVTTSTRATHGPANAKLLYEIMPGTPVAMGRASSLAHTSAGGAPGFMFAAADDSTGRGLTLLWLRLDGALLVQSTFGDAGGQPILLPNSEILELSVLAEFAAGPHIFHVAWRERSATPGKDVIYYDRLRCEPRP